MFKQYLQIIKPRIILGNLISAIGGFLLASKGNVEYVYFLFVLIGISLIVGSSCIFNNFIDTDIDKKMERTKNRPLARGLISPKVTLFCATLLGFFGFLFLWFFVNSLAFWIGAVGFAVYVGIYSLYMKRRSVYGMLAGSLSGSMPPVLGYCSVTNKFDIGAFILLIIFSLWQIPHSYAITIFRIEDYQTAKIPVLPVVKGISETKNHIILYIIAFTVVSPMLSIFRYTGYKYLISITTLNFYWLYIASRRKNNDEKLLARKLFLFSIFIIVLFTIMISIDYT